MLALILYLFAATEPAAAAPPSPPVPGATNTVSGITVQASPKGKQPAPDVTIDMSSNDDAITKGVVIWPATAYQTRADGRVTLSCEFDIHGLAESCSVLSESPAGKGFGAAALELRTTLKLPPPLDLHGQPISMTKRIALTFKAPRNSPNVGALANNGPEPNLVQDVRARKTVFYIDDVTFGAENPLVMHAVTMVDTPLWAHAASFDDLAAAYPSKGGGVEGYVAAHCAVLPTGALTRCEAIKETPAGLGFGKAALSLTSKFQIDPSVVAKAPHGAPLWVDIPVRLPPPSTFADRAITAPTWIVKIDPTIKAHFFPMTAAANGFVTGQGVARCTLAADGSMASCKPDTADPDGFGFSEAAVKLASTMKMNLWSADGAPVEGGVVRIPIRLDRN